MTPTVYTKPGCGGCIATHREMKKRGITYNEVDVTQSPEAFAKLSALGLLQMPVIEWKDEFWTGFRPDKIEEIISGE